MIQPRKVMSIASHKDTNRRWVAAENLIVEGLVRAKLENWIRKTKSGGCGGVKDASEMRIMEHLATNRSKRDFSTARADAFTRSEREEKASARFGRNDRLVECGGGAARLKPCPPWGVWADVDTFCGGAQI
jgi:hypothetical protein